MPKLDELYREFNASLLTSAERHGALTQQLVHIENGLKAIDGIAARLAVAERDIALARAAEAANDIRVREWRDESIKDRAELHAQIETLEKITGELRGQLMFYAGAIAVLSLVAQVVLKLVFHV